MQSIISTFIGIVFLHTIKSDNDNDRVDFLLYECYSAHYSVKVTADKKLLANSLNNYDQSWNLNNLKDKKRPMMIMVTGVMEQLPVMASFLGWVVEEKFSISPFTITIVPCIPLISKKIKNMVHPDVGPVQLSEGVKEGYFLVNLSEKQNFEIEPDFFATARPINDDLGFLSDDSSVHGHSDNEEIRETISRQNENNVNEQQLPNDNCLPSEYFQTSRYYKGETNEQRNVSHYTPDVSVANEGEEADETFDEVYEEGGYSSDHTIKASTSSRFEGNGNTPNETSSVQSSREGSTSNASVSSSVIFQMENIFLSETNLTDNEQVEQQRHGIPSLPVVPRLPARSFDGHSNSEHNIERCSDQSLLIRRSASCSSFNSVSTSTSKKRRGSLSSTKTRPKKGKTDNRHHDTIASSNNLSEITSPISLLASRSQAFPSHDQPKRSVGRPRKNKKEENNNNEKKPRGRPRKVRDINVEDLEPELRDIWEQTNISNTANVSPEQTLADKSTENTESDNI